jgi:hypothetical protein
MKWDIWSKTSAGDMILYRDGLPFRIGYYGNGKHYLEDSMKILPYVCFKLKEKGDEDIFIFNEDATRIIFHLIKSFETPGYILSEYMDCIEAKYCTVATLIQKVQDAFVVKELGF